MSQELLLVDDDANDAALFCLAAKEAGISYPIRVAGSGEEALDLLLGKRFCPVVTFLDIKMPGTDGLEVLRRLRADPLYRNVVIIVLTGSDLESDRVEALKLGCNLFLTKPESLSGYIEMARRIKALLP
ncbi:MAG: response regulator [Elusimicrobia bacterium]|nr:response regulator [Elusimicrobiota bacterium]